MQFSKMHALGNDYIVMETENFDLSKIPWICDRRRGIGADGVLLVESSEICDFRMKIYNADGSRAQMCGNGIRCFAKYVYDKGLTSKTNLTIETDTGIRSVQLFIENEKKSSARVYMGRPTLYKEEGKYTTQTISLGNEHLVFYAKNLDLFPLEKIGPYFSKYPRFRDGVNVEVVKIIDEDSMEMRVWERGVGETLSCGTGACAAVVAACKEGLVKSKVIVKMKNGSLDVEWDLEENQVYLTGEAVHVFDGVIDV